MVNNISVKKDAAVSRRVKKSVLFSPFLYFSLYNIIIAFK